jgi:hypothetical protein
MVKGKFVFVESSFIKAIRWTPNSMRKNETIGFLDVMFIANPESFWRYSDVSIGVFKSMLFSLSKGRYYDENIKGNFYSQKLPIEKIEDINIDEREVVAEHTKERMRLAERTVADIVKLTKECLVRQINDIESTSVISEIDCDSYPALTDFEKTFISAAFDKIKSDILNSINID